MALSPKQKRATNILRSMGVLGATETATGGLAAQKLGADRTSAQWQEFQRRMDTGAMPAGQGGYQPGKTPSASRYPQYSGGVAPITVEPLHQYEKTALQRMASDPFQTQAVDQATAMLAPGGSMSQYISQYAQPISAGAVEGYMNPYQQQVIDRLKENMASSADRERARLTASKAGQRSFGTAREGIQQAEITENLMDREADQIANLLYQGYGDAFTRAQADRGVMGEAAQMVGNQASGLAGLGQIGAEMTGANIRSQLGAGTAIRGFNQGLADRAQAEIDRRINYPASRLSALGQQLSGIRGGTIQNNVTTPSTLTRAATGLSGVADIFGTRQPTIGQQVYSQPVGPTNYLGRPTLSSLGY